MSTHDLLIAFIEASGYEVDTYRHYRELGPEFEVKYKLIPKKTYVPIEVDSDAWGSICSYVLSHKNDIETDINDYGELRPVLDFFNRNCGDE